MGSGTAAGRELEVELALATRKLGASTQHSSTNLGIAATRHSSIILSPEAIQLVKLANYIPRNLQKC